ncbi:MAG: type II toxin-antitoxin system prevent-host-death family antitoxin [Desulfurellaceae bacterium]|nr:type II toxin-antitoxin system prevent-host-death family antitoxin [Desulfurellaceae bacterium]
MRKVGAFEAKTNLSALLDAVAQGETITITKRGRPVARLVPPEAPDHYRAAEAAKNIRKLREQFGGAPIDEILQMRDEGRP